MQIRIYPMTASSRQARVLLVPGLGDSGPGHWQSLWEARDGYLRVQQRDWEHPACSEWIDSLDRAVRDAASDVLIAAHSLGALLVGHWLARTNVRIGGALLVAAPDPGAPSFPPEARGFAPIARQRFDCPSILVVSSDDPYGGLPFARRCAHSWGSRLVNIGKAGHINAASSLGEWREGHRLLESLRTESR
jgi:predicted alpha/beta hydrolase family esterase